MPQSGSEGRNLQSVSYGKECIPRLFLAAGADYEGLFCVNYRGAVVISSNSSGKMRASSTDRPKRADS
jgi:hypothetical protein